MLGLLLKSSLRFHLGQPWQLGLALAGIGLGVAVFVGIQLANLAAKRAFEISSESFRGNATYRLVPIGDALPPGAYEELVLAGFGDVAAPVSVTRARLVRDGRPGRRVTLTGIDPIEELRFGRFFPAGDDAGSAMLRLIAESDTVLVAPSVIAAVGFDESDDSRASLEPGEQLSLVVGGQRRNFRVIGTLAVPPGDDTLPTIVADIATVQALGNDGRISHVDLALTETEAESLRETLPAGTALVDTGNRDTELDGMTQAFTTNLSALGLLALVVGLFLIHATMSFAVVRRRAQFATLRALGASRRAVMFAIAAEAIVIGAIAGAAGTLLGRVLARGMIDLALRTMNDLVFSRAVAAEVAPLWLYPAGICLGIAATVLAALVPAREAASVAPASAARRSTLERGSRRSSRTLALTALPVLGAAAGVLFLGPRNLIVGFIGLFLVLAAGAMCVPAATTLLMRCMEQPARTLTGLPGVMAVRSVTASLSRTGIATAALAVAVATVISIGLMVSSFRDSLVAWIDDTLTADVYVLTAESASPADVERWAGSIEALSEVAGVSRSLRTVLPAASGDVGLRASDPGPEGWGIDLLAGFDPDWATRLAAGDGIVVTEPYAYRRGIEAGSTIVLPAPDGDREYPVLGLMREYNVAGSELLMSLAEYRRGWGDSSLSGIGVHVASGATVAAVIDSVERLRPAGIDAAFRSTDAIRNLSLQLFDRTFEITSVLRALAGVVAFFGVLSAILALQLERRTEFAVLSSIGMSLASLRLNVIWQTALLGLAAGLTAIPIGGALAWLLVVVINRRAFGWTIDFALSWPPIGYGLLVAIAAAGLSGLAAALIDLGTRRSPARHAI